MRAWNGANTASDQLRVNYSLNGRKSSDLDGRDTEAHSTVHGVVFAIFCPGPAVSRPIRAGGASKARVNARAEAPRRVRDTGALARTYRRPAPRNTIRAGDRPVCNRACGRSRPVVSRSPRR